MRQFAEAERPGFFMRQFAEAERPGFFMRQFAEAERQRSFMRQFSEAEKHGFSAESVSVMVQLTAATKRLTAKQKGSLYNSSLIKTEERGEEA